METVQQNGRFTLFSSKFLSIYSILYGNTRVLHMGFLMIDPHTRPPIPPIPPIRNSEAMI